MGFLGGESDVRAILNFRWCNNCSQLHMVHIEARSSNINDVRTLLTMQDMIKYKCVMHHPGAGSETWYRLKHIMCSE